MEKAENKNWKQEMLSLMNKKNDQWNKLERFLFLLYNVSKSLPEYK